MKYYFIFPIIVCLFVLHGCSSHTYPTDDEFHMGIDYPHMFSIQGQGLRITPSDTGYYFIQNSLIYYMDKDSTKAVLLDSRPDHGCLTEPTVENCYAFVEEDASYLNFLQYYNSKLYLLESYWDKENARSKFATGWRLSQLDKDGGRKKVVKSFEKSPRSVIIHRGYLYYSTVSSEVDEARYESSIIRMKLLGDQKEEVLYTAQDVKLQISDLVAYGNQIYWLHSNQDGYRIKRMDLITKELSVIGERNDGGANVLHSISKDRVYFNYFYNEPKDSRTLKIYSSNLKGENIQEVDIVHPPVVSMFKKDDRYSYISVASFYEVDLDEGEPFDLSIYENGEKIFRFDLFSIPRNHYIVTGDDRYIFLFCIDDEEEYYMMLDKEKLGTEEAAFERLTL